MNKFAHLQLKYCVKEERANGMAESNKTVNKKSICMLSE